MKQSNTLWRQAKLAYFDPAALRVTLQNYAAADQVFQYQNRGNCQLREPFKNCFVKFGGIPARR